MNELQKKVIDLKNEKGALILAHYYQTIDIQEVADHVCDSFEMARRARDAQEGLLIICGVRFMAESAKILNPGKTVLLPSPDAGCPMADMVTPEAVLELRRRHPGAAVVCYVNSSASVKAVSDVCCTSSSAVKIVRSLPGKSVIFIPDKNLGSYVASLIPEKDVILYDGYCPAHNNITEADVTAARAAHPGARLLMHPECRPEALRHADYIGSTAGIIEDALATDAESFIIGTESGVTERLELLAPGKTFHPLVSAFICPDMKKTTLADVLESLERGRHEIYLSDEEISAAGACLERMVAIG
ncbi:MAG: quinolinate synthase NadA [Oscillospiraceae bacterium]|nr:quinolinate synthase NadA [Oscillospiraceae bacterium]